MLALWEALVAVAAMMGDVGGASLACPANTVLVSKATVTLGVAGDADALPVTTTTLGPFCIGRTEVTVTEYLACAATGRCPSPDKTVNFPGFGPPEPMRAELSRFCNVTQDGHGSHPMNCVDAAAAASYCAFAGGRLPDEKEWEYAARGPNGNPYPWGAARPVGPAAPLCWDRRESAQGTCVVGQFLGGASPSGALDMAGNVWEWTTSTLGGARVVRGGGWTNFLPGFVRPTYRWPLVPDTRLNCLGFRCVLPTR